MLLHSIYFNIYFNKKLINKNRKIVNIGSLESAN